MNKYFTKRGEKKVSIRFDDETIDIIIRIPTNREHDEMIEAHTEYGQDGSVVTHGAELIEDRLVQFILDLPFEIPVNGSDRFTSWRGADDDVKRFAVNTMDPTLRDLINNAIAGIEEVDSDIAGN